MSKCAYLWTSWTLDYTGDIRVNKFKIFETAFHIPGMSHLKEYRKHKQLNTILQVCMYTQSIDIIVKWMIIIRLLMTEYCITGYFP